MHYSYDVFLSHHNSNKEWVINLKSALAQEGLKVWLDKDEIVAGDRLEEAIEKGLKNSRTIVFVVSQASTNSGWVQIEYARAISLIASEENVSKRIIPILLDESVIPGLLQVYKWIDFRNQHEFSNNIQDLIRGITTESVQTDIAINSEIENYDVSKLFKVPKAFPLKGRTRVVYTCRSSFEKPKFICPSSSADENLVQSRTSLTHTPVDELETLGLSYAWYGSEILGDQEDFVKSSACCSKTASQFLAFLENLQNERGSNNTEPNTVSEINELLLDNLIVIGENDFSNHLFRFVKYQLPWQQKIFYSTGSIITSDSDILTHIKERTGRFNVVLEAPSSVHHRISDGQRNKLEGHSYNWGLITFVSNPFAPDKWILFLIGCRRPGQYLLLSWLRSSAAENVLLKIIEHRKNHNSRFVQVVIGGKPLKQVLSKNNYICRDWDMETVADVSVEPPLPFFSSLPFEGYSKSDWGDPISDLSLLAKLNPENELISSIGKTIPQSLFPFFEDEMKNSEIGYHITLYEFLHTKGYQDQGFINDLLKGKMDFLQLIRDYFEELPRFCLLARQTRMTRTSLQVLADIFVPDKELEKFFDGDSLNYNLMDLVIEGCNYAGNSLRSKNAAKFNVNRSPSPLHLTILRFPPNTTLIQRKDAEAWFTQYNRKVWGKSDDLSIILTAAHEFPFNAVDQVTVK